MMSEAIFNSQDVIDVSDAILRDLKQRAEDSPRKRFRLCLHHHCRDPVQEMLIVCSRDSFVRPHRHPRGKCESYHVVEGKMSVFLFEDDGRVTQAISMSPPGQGNSFLYRLSAPRWHLPVAETQWVVYHEVYQGPFDKDVDVEYAPWSPPEEEVAAVDEYVQSLRSDLLRSDSR